MSQMESAVARPSPADFYPSPPTSPRPVKRTEKAAPRSSFSKKETEPTLDFGSVDSPESRGNCATPVTSSESTPSESTPSESTPSESTPSGSTPSDSTENRASKDEESEAEQLIKWKEALGISNGKCGAIRKSDRETCSNPMPAEKTQEMDDIFKLLCKPCNSSLQLETHLDSLAQLAHCQYHDHPPFREARISDWLKVLPGGPRPPSLQRRLRLILGPAPVKCTSVTKDGNHCRNNIAQARKSDAQKTVRKMIEMAMGSIEQDSSITLLAEVWQHYTLCHAHLKYSFKTQDDWVKRLEEFCMACQSEMNSRIEEEKLKAKEATTANDKADEIILASPPPTPRSRLVHKSPRTFWDGVYETSQFKILGKYEVINKSLFTADMVAREQLNTEDDKSKNEIKDGFVYLYQVSGNDNLVKIGFTTGQVAQRLESWKKDCHREPAQLYPAPDAVCKAVPHAHRVERLVHAELMEHRVRVYCEPCEKQHVEWFKVSVKHAVAVIEKWSLWIQRRPYEKRETRQSVKWSLKAEEAKRLADIAGHSEIPERVGESLASKAE
ncbi:hypothetical protein HC256_009958 [Beauveria bassiana]|nr:hypothetical protein HC256_009958 [Beauveria bassiana]